MFLRAFSTTCALITLTACQTSVDQALISTQPVAPATLAVAQRAVDICSRTPSDRLATAETMAANGFEPTSSDRFPGLGTIQNRTSAFEAANGEVLVVIAKSGSETACLVGAFNMTPEQSYALAQPWVDKFGAITNAERGQGLSNLAVQAWGSLTDERIVYIAAYKTWDVLEAPGSAVRMIHIAR